MMPTDLLEKAYQSYDSLNEKHVKFLDPYRVCYPATWRSEVRIYIHGPQIDN